MTARPRVSHHLAAALALALAGCSDEGDASSSSAAGSDSTSSESSASGDGDGDDTASGDGDGEATGDGDGDDTASGDGDGEPTATGDGDGDDTASGDGDGEATGDGDGDATATGDGDGDVEELCGNGELDPGETCDDGNAASNDGCAASCLVECGFLCLEPGEGCISGFNAVQCASPGPPFGQASPVANVCRLATLSVDGNYIALSPETTLEGQPRHLDAMFTDPANAVYGFAGDTENLGAGSQLVAVDPASGELTAVGPSLGLWVMGAAMNDGGELWVTVFDTYELNATSEVRIAEVDPQSGEIISGPTVLTEGGDPVEVWSIHVSDVAFRFDGAMFVSANEGGPPPPEPLSRYLEVDPDTASVVSAVEGPDDVYAAGIVFVGEQDQIIAMDIRGEDDIFLLDLAVPPALDEMLLYPDPIPTNSGTADLAGCSKLAPQ